MAHCLPARGAVSLLPIVLLAVLLSSVDNVAGRLQMRFGAVYFDVGAVRLRVIHSGTKWCGTGDIADGDDDLGEYSHLDACCRSHDQCFDYIPSGVVKYGLTNDHSFVMSHCDCDDELYKCLKSVNATEEENKEAGNVGDEYFNDFNVKCFNWTLPAECVRNETRLEQFSIIPLLRTKCTQYEYQDGGDNQWQWFDVPFF